MYLNRVLSHHSTHSAQQGSTLANQQSETHFLTQSLTAVEATNERAFLQIQKETNTNTWQHLTNKYSKPTCFAFTHA